MHPMIRRLAADPAEWLWQHTQSRTSCPARCDGGKVYRQTERASWEYPGAWEGRPCERCGGQGYLPRVWRRGTEAATFAGETNVETMAGSSYRSAYSFRVF